MKRNVLHAALLASALALVPGGLPAQDRVAEAERQQAEERYREVTGRLERLEESIAAHQKSVQSLTDEVRKLKDELDRVRNKNESAATQDSFKRLQEAIVEVDKKRLADKAEVAKSFEGLRKLILEKPSGGGGGTRTAEPPPIDHGNTGGGSRSTGTGSTGGTNPGGGNPGGSPASTTGNKGYKYNIRSGDTLSALVTALRKEGHKVTSKIIMDANPGVNWNRLRVGQEIFIPETR